MSQQLSQLICTTSPRSRESSAEEEVVSELIRVLLRPRLL
jgi:hypothetical protein